jgi:hypothetical protein
MNNIYTFLSICFLAISCNPLKVVVAPKTHLEGKKIAILGAYVDRIILPDIPLVNAAFFKPKVKKIQTEIERMQAERTDSIRDDISMYLSYKSNLEVFSGKKLQDVISKNATTKIFDFKENLISDHKVFNKMFISSGDINLFEFVNDNRIRTFKDNESNKMKISQIASLSGCDYLITSYTNERIELANGYYGNGPIITLYTDFFVYDKNGILIYYSKNRAFPYHIYGDELNDFKGPLKSIQFVLYPIIDKFCETLNSK